MRSYPSRAGAVTFTTKLERATPILPGWVFTVSGDGPYTLTAAIGSETESLTVANDKFPEACWNELVQKLVLRCVLSVGV